MLATVNDSDDPVHQDELQRVAAKLHLFEAVSRVRVRLANDADAPICRSTWLLSAGNYIFCGKLNYEVNYMIVMQNCNLCLTLVLYSYFALGNPRSASSDARRFQQVVLGAVRLV